MTPRFLAELVGRWRWHLRRRETGGGGAGVRADDRRQAALPVSPTRPGAGRRTGCVQPTLKSRQNMLVE